MEIILSLVVGIGVNAIWWFITHFVGRRRSPIMEHHEVSAFRINMSIFQFFLFLPLVVLYTFISVVISNPILRTINICIGGLCVFYVVKSFLTLVKALKNIYY